MARLWKVFNQTRKIMLLEEAAVADNFGKRLKGLIGRKSLPGGSGLLIIPCRAVHSCGMRFPIDVGFVDNTDRICYLISNMRPFRFSPSIKKSVYVIEAPAGTFELTGTRTGDWVRLIALTDCK